VTEEGERPRRNGPRKAWGRAREIAFRPTLPTEQSEPRGTLLLVLTIRGSRRLVRRLGEDRIQPRAAALAFHTLLAIVPLLAVSFAILDLVGGASGLQAALDFLASRYLPPSAGQAVDAVLPLLEDLDFDAVGVVGLVTLLPIVIALVAQVELCLTDIFRTRRPKRLRRLLVYAALVIVIPLGAVLTVRYTPQIDPLSVAERIAGPFVVTWIALWLVFRYLPGTRVRSGAAAGGAALAALLLSLAKAGFGLWASQLAHSWHVVWGAVAFVPMVLVWVFVAWWLVLLGAEVAAVIQELMIAMEAPTPSPRRRIRARRWVRPRRRRRARAVRRRQRETMERITER